MKKCLFSIMLALAALTALAQELTFTNGVFFINEDRYGANHGSINFYNYDYGAMEYNVFALVNPGVKLGVTSQHGQVFGGRLFVMSKQANGSEASGSTEGSRLAMLDATTLTQQACILRFGASADSVYDGRAYCGVTPDKGYVSTNAGIFTVHIPDMTVSGPIQGTSSSAKGDYNSLYYEQCGDMVRFGQYVFAVQQGRGLHVIDPATDAVLTTLPFPDIVTVFVTAAGRLYVANNNREVYDFGSGPYLSDFTQVNPVTFETLAVHELGDKGALCAWGAWHARMLCVDPVAERVYYNHEEYQNFISCYDFTTLELTDTLILLPEGVEIMWDGTRERQGLYSSALSFDPHTGDLVVQTTEAAPMYAYQNFNHNWVLFYDAATATLKRQVRLQDAYWFPALAVYPDLYRPEVNLADVTVAAGKEWTVNLPDAVTDRDNMAALIVTTAKAADKTVARAWVSGLTLHVAGVSPGRTTVEVTADSNGQLATATFVVTVTGGSKLGDVNMDGRVSIDDVTDLIDILLGSVLTVYDMAAADVDQNGKLTIDDVTTLIDMLLSH